MEPGDMLFVFSDGLTEARNSSGEFFGEKRVVDMLKGSDAVSAAELGSEILETVQQFAGHSRPSDDLSLIIMKRVAR
jgi:serine phosphatase RsbU (regulator of sigma subunit)